ncbi:MAG: hypothetical protein ABMA25_11400 [Ilumatobacteraceae bacterium]
MHRPYHSVRRLVGAAALAACTLFVVACGSDSGSGASDETFLQQMFASDFEPACRNSPVAGATAYDAARPGIHKVVVQSGADTDELNEGFLDIPSEWTILFDAATDQYATAELVLCVVRTNATLVQECTGYESDGVETDDIVNLYSADYAVSVHAATTGAELGATTISAIATDCPLYVTFTEGEDSTDWYVTDDGAVTDFARQFVET